ncbi:MAG: hypothetical protein HQM09_10645 [Candidatus Riflebacteria bacterium]|nr:hypothetical protein [Candidatus Riflebacteria bacterium]
MRRLLGKTLLMGSFSYLAMMADFSPLYAYSTDIGTIDTRLISETYSSDKPAGKPVQDSVNESMVGISQPISISGATPAPISQIVSVPASEKVFEPVAQKAAEPVSAKTSEPVSQKTAEPVSAKASEPISQKAAEPVSAKVSEPISQKTAEPVSPKASEPISQKAAEPVSVKVSEPISQKTAEPVSPKASESISQKSAKPLSEIVATPVSELVSQKSAEVVSEKVSAPVTEKAVEPVSELVSQKAAELVSQPASEPVVEKAVDPVAVQASEPVSKHKSKSASKRVVKQTENKTVKSVAKPVSVSAAKHIEHSSRISVPVKSAESGVPVDVSDGHWAQSAVRELVSRGIIIMGPDYEFHGNKPASRYDVAIMLSRAIQNIDTKKLRNMNAEDMKLLRVLMADLASEIGMIKKTADQLFHQDTFIEERFAALEKKQDERLDKIEKAKSPVKFNGDYRYWYETSRVADNSKGKGQTSKNTNRFRLGGDIAIDDSTTGEFRFRVDQKVMRDGDLPAAASVIPTVPIGGTTFSADLVYIEKKNVLGGDFRLGRQPYKLGNGLLLMDYIDGLTFCRKYDDEFTFRGAILAENNSPTRGKSHGLDANLLSFEYDYAASHSIMLSRLENQSDFDKYGALTPRTREDWFSMDLLGSFSSKLGYFGTFATYRNDLTINNTTSAQDHLRGDVDFRAYVIGCKYLASKKFDTGLTIADEHNNFRAFDILNLDYEELGSEQPLKEALNAFAITAVNAGTGNMEGVLPPSSGTAAPFATPIKPASGDNRPTGYNLGDIHGYRDLQWSGRYYFRPDLNLRVVADIMAPSFGRYNYRNIKAFTAYLHYQYNPMLHIELRSINVTSEYGRSASDFRTEVFAQF